MLNSKINNVPTHLAIILDGNGRWALRNHLVRHFGHQEGAKRVKEVVQEAFRLNVKYISIFAFSTENWKRPQEEIDYIFSLPKKFFKDNIQYFIDNEVKIIISGDYLKLPKETVDVIEDALNKTKKYSKYILNIALNYGSQAEILKACQEMAIDYKNKKIKLEDFNVETFNKHLYSKELPPIDYLIRTSNEKRISNFMLWQLSYAELYFSKKLWPEFNARQLRKALVDYSKRKRRYGGV